MFCASVFCALCSVRCVLCSVLCSVCCVPCAVCRVHVYFLLSLSISFAFCVLPLFLSLSRSFLLSPLIHGWLAQYDYSACYFSRIIRACFACSLCAAQGRSMLNHLIKGNGSKILFYLIHSSG